MNQELIPLTEKTKWEECLQLVPHSFWHTWDSNHAMHLTSGYKTFLYHASLGQTHVICPVAERTFNGQTDIVTPYGISGFTGNEHLEGLLDHWHIFMKAAGYICAYIAQNPFVPFFQEPNRIPGKPLQNLYALELDLGEAGMFAALNNGRRRKVKKYDSIREDIISDKEILLPFFLENYHAFMEEKQASEVYKFSQKTLISLAESTKTSFYGCKKNGKIIAVSVFGVGRTLADYLFNISLPEGKELSTSLIWHAALLFSQSGKTLLNLGGGIKPGDQLEIYKERFGGRIAGFGSIRVIYNDEIYNSLCLEAGVDSSATNYFPAYRSKIGK